MRESHPMPAEPQPFYRSARRGWYLQLTRNRQVKLGADPNPKHDKDGNPVPPDDVLKKYHQVMAAHEEEVAPLSQPIEVRAAVEVVELFLEHLASRARSKGLFLDK